MKQRGIFLILLGFLCLGLARTACAEEPVAKPNFPLGEHLVFKITWLHIPVGYGEVWAKEKTQLDGREVFHVVGKVQTNRVLRKIYPMRDEIHSWIDAKTLEAIRFEKKIDELRISTHERFDFDKSKKKGYFQSLRDGKKKEFTIQTPVHDFISVFYWVRRQKLAPGQSAKTVLTCDQKDWVLTINALKKETIKHHKRKIGTLKVEPITFVDGVEKRNRAWVNLSDDASRTPLRIVFKAPFGSVIGTLKEMKS